MYRLYLAAVDMLPAAVLLAPVYFALNIAYFHNARKSILYYLFSCYLSVVYILVGLPTVTYIRPELNLNLIPIIGMIDDWKNSILNILLFVPLGMMLPILWSKFSTAKTTVLFGFGMSLVIELLQIMTYRATDINDLITNTLGTLLGFCCTSVFSKKYQLTNNGINKDMFIVLSTTLLLMFFVYPFISAAVWDLILS